MNLELAADYVRRRMEELGHADRYYLRIRHLVLMAGEVRSLSADNQLFVLTTPMEMVSIQSEFGVFDLAATTTNELQYEHQGTIILTNYSPLIRHLIFIQAIPKTNPDNGATNRTL